MITRASFQVTLSDLAVFCQRCDTPNTGPGARCGGHPSRKHDGKPDSYFSIRYSINCKDCEEGLGWASDGWNTKIVRWE